MPFRGERDIERALAAVTAINVWQIGAYSLPPLYVSGVRYRREQCLAPGLAGRETCERFLTALQTYRERWGDCDDLGPWRAAELQRAGELARAIVRPSPVGFHVVVRREDGRIEDPSAILGMPTG